MVKKNMALIIACLLTKSYQNELRITLIAKKWVGLLFALPPSRHAFVFFATDVAGSPYKRQQDISRIALFQLTPLKRVEPTTLRRVNF